MTAVALKLSPISFGWEVVTTDGRPLARFIGFGARWRAEQFLLGFLYR